MEHTRIKLKAIPEPKPNARTAFIVRVSPIIKGVGNVDLVKKLGGTREVTA